MKQSLIARIDWLRGEMMSLASAKGLNDPDVLHISQEIDRLHNKLNELTSDKLWAESVSTDPCYKGNHCAHKILI